MAFLASDPPLPLAPLKPLFFPGLLAKNGEQTFMWPWTYPPVFIPPQVRLLELCFQRISPWHWVQSNRAVFLIPPCLMSANYGASPSILKRLLLKLQLTFFFLKKPMHFFVRAPPNSINILQESSIYGLVRPNIRELPPSPPRVPSAPVQDTCASLQTAPSLSLSPLPCLNS